MFARTDGGDEDRKVVGTGDREAGEALGIGDVGTCVGVRRRRRRLQRLDPRREVRGVIIWAAGKRSARGLGGVGDTESVAGGCRWSQFAFKQQFSVVGKQRMWIFFDGESCCWNSTGDNPLVFAVVVAARWALRRGQEGWWRWLVG